MIHAILSDEKLSVFLKTVHKTYTITFFYPMTNTCEIIIRRQSKHFLRKIPARVIIDNKKYLFYSSDEKSFEVPANETMYLIFGKNNVLELDADNRERVVLNIKEGLFSSQYLFSILGIVILAHTCIREYLKDTNSNLCYWVLAFLVFTVALFIKNAVNNYFSLEEE